MTVHFITQFIVLALIEDGAFHKRRTLLEQVKWGTLWLAGLAQGAKKSRTDMYNVSVRLWAPKPAKTSSLSTESLLEEPIALTIPILV